MTGLDQISQFEMTGLDYADFVIDGDTYVLILNKQQPMPVIDYFQVPQWTDEGTEQNVEANTAATYVTRSSGCEVYTVGYDNYEAIPVSVESVSEEPIFTEEQLHGILLRT